MRLSVFAAQNLPPNGPKVACGAVLAAWGLTLGPEAHGSEFRFSEGWWRGEVAAVRGVRNHKIDRSSDSFVLASIEYERPAYKGLALFSVCDFELLNRE